MAIGKISGAMLRSNLDRQGVDLQFSTYNQPLVYLNFASFLVGINTSSPTETMTVDGTFNVRNILLEDGESGPTITTTNNAHLRIAPEGNLKLGDVYKVKIEGGDPNDLLITDGNGNLSWTNLEDLSGAIGLDGMHIALTEPSDGSLVDWAAYRNFTEATTVTDAIDTLNQVMLNVYQNTYVGSADFTANIVAGPAPLTVQFTSTTTGNPTNYHWDFGDGQTSNLPDPTHTFTNPVGGFYDVYFKAFNNTGTDAGNGQGSFADVLKDNYITLYTPMPVPLFNLPTVTINDGNTVSLTNTSQFALSYVIQWGDGSFDIISDNNQPGGIHGGPIAHRYNNTNGDTRYNITVEAYSPTAGPGGESVTSAPTLVKVYSTHLPQFTATNTSGINQHDTVPNGLNVVFTNTTPSNPGSTATFGSGNYYRWVWGDGTFTTVNIASGQPGDTAQNITHAYTLSDPTVQQTFNAYLEVYNSHTSSRFISSQTIVTVIPAATAQFTATVGTLSDRPGDNDKVGYLYTDLNGVYRGNFVFDNTSFNTDSYTWVFGDSTTQGPLVEGVSGTPTGADLLHSYNANGVFSPQLNVSGPTGADSLIRVNYLTVNNPPVPPANVSTKTLTIASLNADAAVTAGYTDSSSSGPAAGTLVNRITTMSPVVTNTLTDVYNSHSGTLSALFNGTSDGSIAFTPGDDSGIYGSLQITVDRDAHLMSPSVYPSNFYKVFTGRFSKNTSGVTVGYNTVQLSHTTEGSTNTLGFVKDDVTAVPTLDYTGAQTVVSTPGTYKYISGVPYFTTGGEISVQNVKAYNWIGQTYKQTTTPLTVSAGTLLAGSGTVTSSQNKTYLQINGATSFLTSGIPNVNTGKTSATPYTLGNFSVSINGTTAVTQKLNVRLQNVNGNSSFLEIPNPVNLYNTTYTGFNELSIPVSLTLGSAYTDNGKRIYIAGATGATPAFNSATNYYVNNPFQGAINVEITDEAIVRFGTLHYNQTDYSTYLPPGPNLSIRSGTQYLRFAFRRATIANFKLTYSGRISGIWIAVPGTQIDSTSTLNKWLSAQQIYAGAGIPGANTGAGGNGSNGCAVTPTDIPTVGTYVLNDECNLTLGSENTSNSTGNMVLVNIALVPGDYLESISVS